MTLHLERSYPFLNIITKSTIYMKTPKRKSNCSIPIFLSAISAERCSGLLIVIDWDKNELTGMRTVKNTDVASCFNMR
jgi:hypothetical protein